MASSTVASRGWNSTRDVEVSASLWRCFFLGVFAGVGNKVFGASLDSSISVSEEAGESARALNLRGVERECFPNLDWE
jgi:hypothetical protein